VSKATHVARYPDDRRRVSRTTLIVFGAGLTTGAAYGGWRAYSTSGSVRTAATGAPPPTA
jgi:hypothetical protein